MRTLIIAAFLASAAPAWADEKAEEIAAIRAEIRALEKKIASLQQRLSELTGPVIHRDEKKPAITSARTLVRAIPKAMIVGPDEPWHEAARRGIADALTEQFQGAPVRMRANFDTSRIYQDKPARAVFITDDGRQGSLVYHIRIEVTYNENAPAALAKFKKGKSETVTGYVQGFEHGGTGPSRQRGQTSLQMVMRVQVE